MQFQKVFRIGAFAGTSLLAAAYLMDVRASAYSEIVMPFIHEYFDPEDAHAWSIWMAKNNLVPRQFSNPDPSKLLKTSLWGKTFSNPLGISAGYDKNGEAVDALLGFGFGFVEIGSVTPLPQPGNPKPRMFRLAQDAAVINRYGFNSHGHFIVQDRLKTRAAKFQNSYTSGPVQKSLVPGKVLGINLGKNKTSVGNADYLSGIASLGPLADYIVINVSSPNTPGLRNLQRREPMMHLLTQAKDARDLNAARVPLLVKIAPDVSEGELEDIAHVVKSVGVDGIIIGNTSVSRPDTLQSENRVETGGLSGPPILPLALDKVRLFYKLTSGSIPIIGCGGISTAEDAIKFARAGASLVQLYTAFAYKGPGVADQIQRNLVQYLESEGTTWEKIVGSDHNKDQV